MKGGNSNLQLYIFNDYNTFMVIKHTIHEERERLTRGKYFAIMYNRRNEVKKVKKRGG